MKLSQNLALQFYEKEQQDSQIATTGVLAGNPIAPNEEAKLEH